MMRFYILISVLKEMQERRAILAMVHWKSFLSQTKMAINQLLLLMLLAKYCSNVITYQKQSGQTLIIYMMVGTI